MNFGSVCSGIEAASVAWHRLGWRAAFLSEIERFPCAVLAHHYPSVPNFGDMTRFMEWPDANIDVLVGGTPCQSFSVAGLRKGLDDPRGNLMLTYGAIAGRYRPRWLVWENVPGVLSSNGGRDFGAFLGMLGELGYGFAYRVLDAQHFGVPQRRRRVFVVGCLGDWRRAAAVLFERHSLQGNIAPSREARKGVTGGTSRRPDSGHVVNSLTANNGQRNEISDVVNGSVIPVWPASLASTLNAAFGSKQGLEDQHALHGAPLFVPTAFGWQNSSSQGDSASCDVTPTLDKSKTPAVMEGVGVRRITPVEAERLQGFPDGYTDIRAKNKPTPDGPRYKALGNSMAVPVMTWIGQRIAAVSNIL